MQNLVRHKYCFKFSDVYHIKLLTIYVYFIFSLLTAFEFFGYICYGYLQLLTNSFSYSVLCYIQHGLPSNFSCTLELIFTDLQICSMYLILVVWMTVYIECLKVKTDTLHITIKI